MGQVTLSHYIWIYTIYSLLGFNSEHHEAQTKLYEILQITLLSSFWGALSVNDNERQNLINMRWCIDVFAIRTTCKIHSFSGKTKYNLYAHNVDT